MAKIITVCVVIAVIVYVIARMPLFFNCMTPGEPSFLKIDNFLKMTGTKQTELTEDGDGVLAANGEEVWVKWDDRFAFVNTDAAFAEKYVQTNVMFGKVEVVKGLDGEETRKVVDPKYVTIIMYTFKNVKSSSAFGESQAKAFGGQHEFKDMLLYKLGMADGKTDTFAYNAWYNGGNYVEVYGTDKELVTNVRTIINYHS